jgi:KUP system potassium uptake protein
LNSPIVAKNHGVEFDMMDASFFVSREVVAPTHCRRHLFTRMVSNAKSAAAYAHIPSNRVLELGTQVKY